MSTDTSIIHLTSAEPWRHRKRKYEFRTSPKTVKREVSGSGLIDNGDGLFWLSIKVSEAAKVVSTFEAIATRDRDAGRPASMLLAERLRGARAALAAAERALVEAKSMAKTKQTPVVDDDED